MFGLFYTGCEEVSDIRFEKVRDPVEHREINVRFSGVLTDSEITT